MSRYIQKIVLLLLLFISQFTYSQIYPVQAVPVVLSPYSSKLSDYSNPMVNRINLQLITTDLLVTNRPALLFVKIQGNGITAQSAPVLSGINPIYLNGGEILSLTSADIAGYFRFQNLQGLTTTRYSDPLPDGVYTICFQVYDLMTKKWLSQNSCATVYLMLNDPPQLNLPSNNEQIPSTDFPNIVFSWTPRHLNATNVSYEFELKEILNTSLDPAFAFEVSPLLLKEENLRTSTLLYDVSKPTLIPGKTYAWRVKAVSTNGLAENAVFKNNGYSQVFSFKYTANCSAPRFLLSEQQSRSGVKLMWQGENSHKKYHIQYRKANVENAEWFEVHTINTQTLLQGLEAGFTYEFRVGASCEMEQYGTPQSFVYSGIQTFTINKEENATSYNCGIVPKIEITNQQPLPALAVNETFMAGDFPVKVLNVTGSNGIFSGSGYIQVPYLFDTRIGVEFNNVRINSDYQLVDGVVETTYDPDWSNVDFIDDLWDVNQQSETVDFPINSADDITVSPGGDIVVTGPDGQTETFPGGKDTVITDSTGKSYYVDAEGNVSGPFDQADGGKPTPENTDGVDKNGEVTALTAEGIKVTFEKINNETQYAFDLVTYGKELTKDYKKVDGLFVPFKAVPNGLTDKILAKVTLSGTNVVADSLFFKTQNGVKIDAVKEGEHFVLTLKGAQKFAVEEVQATIKQGNKYKIAGVFNLVHVSPRTVKLKLVPTSSSINVADKIDEIKAVYNQLAINVQVDVLEPFDISGYLGGGKLPTEDAFGDLSTYSTAQKAIINDFTKQRNPEQAYYIFVTNATSSTGQGGYMALGNQFGFVFNQSAKTIAHEFGHGALRLEHPFKQYKNKGLNKGDTQSIMDYANGTDLLFTDWKQINDPKFRLYAFQGQSEGEFGGIRLTPDWMPFTYGGSSTHGPSTSCINNGGICSIVDVNDITYYYHKNYIKEGKNDGPGYFSDSGSKLVINTDVGDVKNVIVVDYKGGKCGILYDVKFSDLKKYSVDSNINFETDIIFTNPRDIDCSGNGSGNGSGGLKSVDDLYNRKGGNGQGVDETGNVVDYTGRFTADEIKAMLGRIAKTTSSTGVKGKIFITDENTDEAFRDKVKARYNNPESKELVIWLDVNSTTKEFKIYLKAGTGLPEWSGKSTAEIQKMLEDNPGWIDDFWLPNFNPLTAILDGLAELIGKAEIPDRFYNPDVQDYNPFPAKIYSYVTLTVISDELNSLLDPANSKYTTSRVNFAFVCGVWNGLIETAAGIPEGGSFLIKMITNENNSRTEFVDAISKISWDNVKDMAGKEWDKYTANPCMVSYGAGKVTFVVASCFVGVGEIKGVTAVVQTIEKLDVMGQLLSKTVQIAGKVIKPVMVGTGKSAKFVYKVSKAFIEDGVHYTKLNRAYSTIVPIPIDITPNIESAINKAKELLSKNKGKFDENIVIRKDELGNPVLDGNGNVIADIDIDGQKVEVILSDDAVKAKQSVDEIVKSVYISIDDFTNATISKSARREIRDVIKLGESKELAQKFYNKNKTDINLVPENMDFETWYEKMFIGYNYNKPLNFEVHHVIPVNVFKGNKELQELLYKFQKEFDFNGLDNGIPLQKKSIRNEITGHANHPNYDDAIAEKLNEILENETFNEVRKFREVQKLINTTKQKLEVEVLLGNKDVNQIINF